MNATGRFGTLATIAGAGLALGLAVSAIAQDSPNSTTAGLAGLWKAKNRFGPDVRGLLTLRHRGEGWEADLAGRKIAVAATGGTLSFTLPDGQGQFRARVTEGRLSGGQWIPPLSAVMPRIATNIRFRQTARDEWQGRVEPYEDTSTLFLMITRIAGGQFGAFLRNPERNVGRQYRVSRLVRDGDRVSLYGQRGAGPGNVRLMAGVARPDAGLISLAFPDGTLGGTFDFAREGDDSDFYPRGRVPERYSYRPPPVRADGWTVGSLADAGIDQAGIEAFVQRILETPIDSTRAPALEALLIARHGKLVLEEYFHGFSRERLHETRSASKSLTSIMVGAALRSGAPVRLSDKVFTVMNGGAQPAGLEPGKAAMTLENLLTMTSGFHCDDRDPKAPGNEDVMLDQDEEPDFYRFTMRAPLDRLPGVKAVYCSGDANLALGMLSRATGEHPMDLFDRLLGGPLQIERHGWYLSPSFQPYGGGSVKMRPRDFMKLGQLMLDKGRWNGRRILDEDFVEAASAPRYALKNIRYGYLWWVIDWPYKDRSVRAFFAGGNGGQSVIVIPELDMVVATFGANFSDRAGLEIQQGYTPRHILPAVREPGDPPGTVSPREYKIVYEIPPGQD